MISGVSLRRRGAKYAGRQGERRRGCVRVELAPAHIDGVLIDPSERRGAEMADHLVERKRVSPQVFQINQRGFGEGAVARRRP